VSWNGSARRADNLEEQITNLYDCAIAHWHDEPAIDRSADSLVRAEAGLRTRGQGCPRSHRRFTESLGELRIAQAGREAQVDAPRIVSAGKPGALQTLRDSPRAPGSRAGPALQESARVFSAAFPRRTGRVAFVAVVLALTLCVSRASARAPAPRPPNIIFIIADDLGIGDLGCYGQKKIRTPNVDLLATEGMRLGQHYSGNAVCAPSRCVLMTGLHPGHAWIRDNQEVQPEGQAPLPAGTMTLARLLQRHGYATGAFGKWGLGAPGSAGDPLRQGFDRFFGYNCQRQAHNYYPVYLWDNDQRVTLDNPPFSAHQRFPAGADAAQPASYERYQGREYAPDRIMEQARAFIRENRDRPFFCFVPTTVPHLALQVPTDSLDEYAGAWPDEPYLGDRSYLEPVPEVAVF